MYTLIAWFKDMPTLVEMELRESESWRLEAEYSIY